MKNTALYTILAITCCMAACNCSNTQTTTVPVPTAGSIAAKDSVETPLGYATPADPDFLIVPGGEKMLGPQMQANLEANFRTHMFAQNEGNWGQYVDGYYPPMVQRYQRDSLIKLVSTYAEVAGCWNKVVSFEYDKISPLVETDTTYLVMIRAKVKLDVVFDEKFSGKPSDWQGMVKDKYPSAIFDEPNRTYHIDEKMKFYGITHKDKIDFRFLVHSYFNDPKLSNLIDQTSFMALRRYE